MLENPRWDFTVSLQSQILLTNKKSGNHRHPKSYKMTGDKSGKSTKGTQLMS